MKPGYTLLLALAVLCPAEAAQPTARPGAHGGQHLKGGAEPAVREGVLPWSALAGVERVREGDRFVPQFPAAVAGLQGREVKLQGYMMPLEPGDMQKRFILSAMPPSCAFCVIGGPERAIEVQAARPVKFGFSAMVITGRLELLRDDPMGLFYRLRDASSVAP
jgi:uncharacterized protein